MPSSQSFQSGQGRGECGTARTGWSLRIMPSHEELPVMVCVRPASAIIAVIALIVFSIGSSAAGQTAGCRIEVGSLAVDPQNPSRVYAGTNPDGATSNAFAVQIRSDSLIPRPPTRGPGHVPREVAPHTQSGPISALTADAHNPRPRVRLVYPSTLPAGSPATTLLVEGSQSIEDPSLIHPWRGGAEALGGRPPSEIKTSWPSGSDSRRKPWRRVQITSYLM